MSITDKQRTKLAELFNDYANKLPEDHYLEGTDIKLKDILHNGLEDESFYKAVEDSIAMQGISFEEYYDKTKDSHQKSLQQIQAKGSTPPTYRN